MVRTHCPASRAWTIPGGLPIGVRVAAHPWREDIALAVARRLEEIFGGSRHRMRRTLAPLLPAPRSSRFAPPAHAPRELISFSEAGSASNRTARCPKSAHPTRCQRADWPAQGDAPAGPVPGRLRLPKSTTRTPSGEARRGTRSRSFPACAYPHQKMTFSNRNTAQTKTAQKIGRWVNFSSCSDGISVQP